MRMKALTFLGVVALVAGCGTQVCVLGMGDCAAMFSGTSSSSTTTSYIGLKISGVSAVSLRSPTVTYVPSGGTSPYTFSISSSSAVSGCGSFNPSGSTTLSTEFTALATGNCTIQVTDSSSPSLTQTATIVISN